MFGCRSWVRSGREKEIGRQAKAIRSSSSSLLLCPLRRAGGSRLQQSTRRSKFFVSASCSLDVTRIRRHLAVYFLLHTGSLNKTLQDSKSSSFWVRDNTSYHSLNSPACWCVSIALPASS